MQVWTINEEIIFLRMDSLSETIINNHYLNRNTQLPGNFSLLFVTKYQIDLITC